jgi:hypothetical protein
VSGHCGAELLLGHGLGASGDVGRCREVSGDVGRWQVAQNNSWQSITSWHIMSYEPHEDEHSVLEWLKNAPDMEALWTLWALWA